MPQNNTMSNNFNSPAGTMAPLTNVGICLKALQRSLARPAHLPGMVCFYGPSGWGKSTAAAYVTNKLNAYYIECKSSWTRKAILNAILSEMGIMPENTIYQMADQVYEQLAISGRPLIIDEMDYMVSKGAVEIIRDIYEGSKAAILLIGEERLPKKLERWERFGLDAGPTCRY
jgi:DNA transposition AAA+ family ATPase